MNYIDSVNFIHSLLKFGIRPGLNGMDALLSCLGNPQNDMKYVHIAGTNGKGSTSTAMSNVLINAGLKVGLYTSPYVTEFLERVQFNGKPVDKNIFSNAVEKVKKALEELNKKDVVITEFEALTASAFLCFKELKCDVVVLEVGLGGRLDATNIIDTPLLNIITSLSLDHTGVLGETIEEIAYEKCGTIKENSLVVSSIDQPKAAFKVIESTVKEKKGNLTVADKNQLEIIKSDLFGTEFIYKNQHYNIAMSGVHQVKNMLCVIEGAEVLKKHFKISENDVKNGIKSTVLPARVEVLSKKPLVVLDGGHNEDGAVAFFKTIEQYLNPKGKVYVLAGMMADKAVEKSLAPLMIKTDVFISVTPENPRAMKADELNKIALKYSKSAVAIPYAKNGINYIFENLTDDDVFLSVGSLYLAGEVRELIKKSLI